MDFKEIEAKIDQEIEEALTSVEPEKRQLAQVVLESTRRSILGVLHQQQIQTLTLDNVNDICSALDNAKLVHDQSVLERVGLPNLGHDVLNARTNIKWDFLISKLKDVIDEGEPFTPNSIKKRDDALYQALKTALMQGIGKENGFDWEMLKIHLPEEMQSLFHPETLSKDEKRGVIIEDTRQVIEKFKLEEAVAALGHSPKALSAFLEIAAPDLSPLIRARIVHVAFKGLRNDEASRMEKLVKCKESFGQIEVRNDVLQRTTEKILNLSVRVPKGVTELLVRGPYVKNIKVSGDRNINFTVPLEIAQMNQIFLVAHNYDFKGIPEDASRSPVAVLTINQISPDTTDDLRRLLSLLKQDKIKELQQDEEKKAAFIKNLEKMAIKRFANSFDEGVAYIETFKAEELQKGAKFVASCLDQILKRFRQINARKYPFLRKVDKEGRPLDLAFFQKFCVYMAIEMMKSGHRAVLLANEPGLGKTVTALAIAHDMEPVIVCPNQAASTWVEEEAKFFKKPFLTKIAGMGTARGTQMIEARVTPGIVVNVEFIRDKGDGKSGKKFEAVNEKHFPDRSRMLIIDEAHFLKNTSDQSTGYLQLEGDYELLLTASPWRNPKAMCAVMAKVLPDDDRFKSEKAFKEVFDANNPKDLKFLFDMMEKYVIRFLKEDVMPTFDPNISLEQQQGLPVKEYVDPITTGIGSYVLTPAQENAILELFENWQLWNENYERYLPRGKKAREDGLRKSDDRLSKFHALCHVMNHPKYVGSLEQSPKHQEAMKIVEQELFEGHKVLIFCRYQSQVREYAETLKQKGIQFTTYYGEVKKSEGVNKNGYKIDSKGKQILYKTDQFDNYCLEGGRPVIANKGEKSGPIQALDYERLVFQNDPNIKVCLATYSTGSQSVTFSAANAIIHDGIPRDATEQYQAEDRIHRMDSSHKKYRVKYYTLAAQYSPEFLDQMREHVIENNADGEHLGQNVQDAYSNWFEQGTYDEVQIKRLASQRMAFEILNNGIANDPDLINQDISFRFPN